MVHLVLYTRGIVPTFLKFDSWSPGAGFIPIISTKGINQIKKRKNVNKSSVLCIQKIKYIFKRWVKFRVGGIPRLPKHLSPPQYYYLIFGLTLEYSNENFSIFLFFVLYIIYLLSIFVFYITCTFLFFKNLHIYKICYSLFLIKY